MEENKKDYAYGKKPLWFWILVYVVIAAVVYGIIYYFFFANKGGYATTFNTPTQNQAIASQQVKFSDSPDAKYAYLISTDNYDATTQQALVGFQVTKKVLPDGSQEITLNAQNPEYQTQTYTIKPDQKLYFIERFLGDDKNNEEKNPGDDAGVVVDANGYVVSQ